MTSSANRESGGPAACGFLSRSHTNFGPASRPSTLFFTVTTIRMGLSVSGECPRGSIQRELAKIGGSSSPTASHKYTLHNFVGEDDAEFHPAGGGPSSTTRLRALASALLTRWFASRWLLGMARSGWRNALEGAQQCFCIYAVAAVWLIGQEL